MIYVVNSTGMTRLSCRQLKTIGISELVARPETSYINAIIQALWTVAEITLMLEWVGRQLRKYLQRELKRTAYEDVRVRISSHEYLAD